MAALRNGQRGRDEGRRDEVRRDECAQDDLLVFRRGHPDEGRRARQPYLEWQPIVPAAIQLAESITAAG
jgi:hypothetical protein